MASFCITAPDGAKDMIKSASYRCVTDGTGVINEIVSAFPECKSVEIYLCALVGGSGTNVIRYANTRTWSVQRITPIREANPTLS